jgi:hypothetical protein
VVREGQWQLLESLPAWDGNSSSSSFVNFGWLGANEEMLLVVVNYSAYYSQCYLPLPFENMPDSHWRLQDQLGEAIYDRAGNALVSEGLYLDVPPWQTHIFSLTRLKK